MTRPLPALPDPICAPAAFLQALSQHPAPAETATAAGIPAHSLANPGVPAGQAALLHAAGARALAASLARGGPPMLLVVTGLTEAAAYGAGLSEGVMGYERIHWTATEGRALILILPPSGRNAFWDR